VSRRQKYNWTSKNSSPYDSKDNNKRIISASELFETDKEIEAKYDENFSSRSSNIGDELVVDAMRDTQKLTRAINNILSNPKNWIVSEIKKEDCEVLGIELKPIDISPYCSDVFEKCSKTLIMSATILNSQAFCRSIGLPPDEVKFIQVESDFPSENRPIYPMNTAYLNYNSLKLEEVKVNINRTIDNLMNLHRNQKGIIHTTSYEQLNFIKENISNTNARRLLVTDPQIQRDEVIAEHVKSSTKPTVLISPSLHTGLDLKNELSRFQIITKVPYPNKGDRWTNAKSQMDQEWYYWQTALKLIQAYGRSIRSKDDWAKTYVLDSAFGYFIKKNKNILPDWFTQAIKDKL
jgi:ATP-dependent DNA helicase DinG